MTANCLALEDKRVFYYSGNETKEERVRFSGNVSVELYFDLASMISQAILKNILLPEMSDKELIAAAEQTGTFEFWNNAQDDVYNKLL